MTTGRRGLCRPGHVDGNLGVHQVDQVDRLSLGTPRRETQSAGEQMHCPPADRGISQILL